MKAQTVVKITAKTGTISASANLTLATGASYAGNWSGSFFSDDGGLGTITFTVAASGTISGTATVYNSTSTEVSTLSGSVSSLGVSSITVTNSQGVQHNTGTFVYQSGGYISGVMVGLHGTSVSRTVVSASKTSTPLMYAGTYSGTSVKSTGPVYNLTSFSISSTGAITATSPDLQNVHGSINSLGVATLTATASGTTETGTFYFAFDAGGMLNGYKADGNGAYTSITLTKSYQGVYTINANPGTVYLVVTDSGAVFGATVGTVIPYAFSGTVSSNGALNVAMTPATSNNQHGTGTLTGNLVAEGYALLGSGSVLFSDSTTNTWSAVGAPSCGLVELGKYTVNVPGGPTFQVTIDANGIITGSSTGINLYGAVTGAGEVVMFAIPTASGSTAGIATLTGAFTSATAGNGVLTVLDGNTGTWTATKN